MLNRSLFLVITTFALHPLSVDVLTAPTETAVTVEEMPQGYIISVDAFSEPLENILRKLGEQCRVNFACRERHHPVTPISIHFKDLPLEQAIRKLIRAAGIKNYLIRYSDRDDTHQSITEVILFANGTMREATVINSGTDPLEKQIEPSGDRKAPSDPCDGYSQKISSFKNRYLWEDEETREWAIHLLEAIPDEAKNFGLDAISKELDQNSGPERTTPLTAAVFYESIEAAAPPKVAPIMMQQVRRLSEQYYINKAHERAYASGNGF